MNQKKVVFLHFLRQRIMLLIYVPKLTNRVGYTMNVVMHDILKIDFAITTNAEVFDSHAEARLCYAPQPVFCAKDDSGDLPYLYIKSARLLFETSIEDQDLHCFKHEGLTALFPVFNRHTALPFDPFAAIFFMLSRYEEYLPHHRDEHGRFMVTESVAYREGFLQTAVVDRWAMMVKEAILQRYPDMVFGTRTFTFVQTVDIDAAYCYLHKGAFRTTLGILRDGIPRKNIQEVKRRIKVLRGLEQDPYDTFDYIIERSRSLARHSKLLVFALVGDYGIYDKPASYQNNDFRQLLQHLGDYAKVGIHGSYYSAEEPERLDREIKRLSDIMHRTIVRNRFHFLRFSLPSAYRNLVRYGIAHDYSMGYAELPGFRCGTCSIVPFFDLNSNQECDLKIHPFMAMDTTFHTYMDLTPEQATEQFHALIDEVRSVGGTFSCIFHNQNLCENYGWEGWQKVYEDVLQYAGQN